MMLAAAPISIKLKTAGDTAPTSVPTRAMRNENSADCANVTPVRRAVRTG